MKIIDKVPPNAPELEAAVLGAIMNEKDAIHEVVEIISTEEVFYNTSNKNVYQAILYLFKRGEPIDTLTVIEQTKKNGTYDKIGGEEKGSYYIANMTTQVNSSAHITTHALILIEKFIKRQAIIQSLKTINDCYDDSKDAFSITDQRQSDVIESSNYANIGGGFKSYKQLALLVIDELAELREGKVDNERTSTGLKNLDIATGKFGKGDLIIIAGRPGMGKSVLGSQIANYNAIYEGKTTAFFSLEMRDTKLMKRTFASEAMVSNNSLKTGVDITDDEWVRLCKTADDLSVANAFVDKTPAMSLVELKAKSKKLLISQGRLDLIVIDYLQLMTNSVKGGNREQEIGSISRGLKELAKELDIPIIALAQLSRKVEDRGGDKKPMLSDLRESGSIEQDADQVMFMYRPEYYNITETEEGESTIGLANVIIAKNRDASTAVADLEFKGQYTRFEDWHTEEQWNTTQPSQADTTNTDYQKASNNYDEPLPNSTDFFG